MSLDFLRQLARLSWSDEGPRLAREFLAKHGIPLVVVPHLRQNPTPMSVVNLSKALQVHPAIECSVVYVDEERQPGAILKEPPLEGGALTAVMDNTFHQDACRARTFERAVTCPSTTVYQGDTLALDVASENPASRIGIVDPDWNIFLLPAERNAERGAPPGVRIVAGSETARAYSYESAAGFARSVQVETRAGRVFTKSGWYGAISVPGPQCDTVTDVGACWIRYLNAPPPR